MSAPVVQWQMVTKDPEEAARFYGALFGWKVGAQNALRYRQVDTGGTPGGIWPAPAEGPGFVQLFVAVPDVAAAAERAQALGASIVVPPTVLPDGDTMAILHDPNGVPFGLVRG